VEVPTIKPLFEYDFPIEATEMGEHKQYQQQKKRTSTFHGDKAKIRARKL
jgi:hypothetical protein